MSANPVNPVDSGAARKQILYIEGPIFYRQTDGSDWKKIELVDDGTDSGILVFKETAQSSDNEMPV